MTEEQKRQVREAKAWCHEQREHALAMIDDYKKGRKDLRGTGRGPNSDVTEKHKQHYIEIARQMERLITVYEKFEA